MSRERKVQGELLNGGRAISKGIIISLICCLVVLAIGAGLISSGTMGKDMEGGLRIAALLLGSLIGGACAAAALGSRLLLVGLAVGAGETLIWCLAGLLPGVGGTGEIPVLVGACLLGGGLSGILLAPVKKRKK